MTWPALVPTLSGLPASSPDVFSDEGFGWDLLQSEGRIDSLLVGSIKADKIASGTITGETIVLSGGAAILRSSNYVAATSGWSIEGDGDAEFNNVTVRGTIYATAGEIGGLTITGALTLGTGGVFRTATSGQRLEIARTNFDRISFYTGNVNETSPATIVSGSTGIAIWAPTLSSGNGLLTLLGGGAGSGINITPAQTMEFGTTGNATAPAIARQADSDTGIFWIDPNILAFSVGGTERVRFTTTQVFIPSGTAAAPAMAFWSDNGTGVYSVGASRLGFAIGGVHVAEFNAGKFRTAILNSGSPEMNMGSLSPSASQPSYGFQGDSDTGYYWVSDGISAISGNGQISMVFDAPNSDIRAGVDNTYNLGNASFRFVDVWAVDTTINSSDRRKKTAIRRLAFDPMSMVREVPVVQFRRHRRKRTHTGWIAQDVAAWLDERGLDYAMLIDPSRNGEEGQMGLRIGELTAVLWAACQQLDRRLSAIEGKGA